MYCGNCGVAEQDGKFCANCGFQNKGVLDGVNNTKDFVANSVRPKSNPSRKQVKISFWEIIGACFGATWIFTGINILSDPNCNSVLPASGSRYTLSLACSTSGEGGQGMGAVLALLGVAIILFSLRKLLFKKEN